VAYTFLKSTKINIAYSALKSRQTLKTDSQVNCSALQQL